MSSRRELTEQPMDELPTSPVSFSGWRERVAGARKSPREAVQLAREANSRGEHMLALALAEGALRQLSLVASPHETVSLRQQIALALARSGETEQALEVLQDSLVVSPPDAGVLGILGRLHKDFAERARTVEDAERHLRQAGEFYAKGFALEQSFHCGINAAVLAALTGETARAQKTARCVLQLPPVEDRLWSSATIATAWMICGDEERARQALLQADRAGATRRADLAVVRKEVRKLAAVLHSDSGFYDNCFGPAAVAAFYGRGEKLGDSECARLARWLEDHHVVCAWSAVASGEEVEFLERAAPLGVETCAVLPGAMPRSDWRKAVERASFLDLVDGGEAQVGGADELARYIATARAAARAASWDVPLLTVSAGAPPSFWENFPRESFVLREPTPKESAAATCGNGVSAVLCISTSREKEEHSLAATHLRKIWGDHPARHGSSNGSGGPCLFAWPTIADAVHGAMELQKRVQSGSVKNSCTFVLHASAGPTPDARLTDWARRVYPGRIHTTGRFADLAALEFRKNFDLSYVGTIDCQAEPLGTRLYQLRSGHGNGAAR